MSNHLRFFSRHQYIFHLNISKLIFRLQSNTQNITVGRWEDERIHLILNANPIYGFSVLSYFRLSGYVGGWKFDGSLT